MRIPKTVKVGGITYKIVVAPQGDFTNNACGEIYYNRSEIRITDGETQYQARALLHEVVHAIYAHLGYNNHPEKEVDELAGVLYALIVDNPEMFEPESAPRPVMYVSDAGNWEYSGKLPPAIAAADISAKSLMAAVEKLRAVRRETDGDDEATLALCKKIIKTIEAKKKKPKADAQ